MPLRLLRAAWHVHAAAGHTCQQTHACMGQRCIACSRSQEAAVCLHVWWRILACFELVEGPFSCVILVLCGHVGVIHTENVATLANRLTPASSRPLEVAKKKEHASSAPEQCGIRGRLGARCAPRAHRFVLPQRGRRQPHCTLRGLSSTRFSSDPKTSLAAASEDVLGHNVFSRVHLPATCNQ